MIDILSIVIDACSLKSNYGGGDLYSFTSRALCSSLDKLKTTAVKALNT